MISTTKKFYDIHGQQIDEATFDGGRKQVSSNTSTIKITDGFNSDSINQITSRDGGVSRILSYETDDEAIAIKNKNSYESFDLLSSSPYESPIRRGGKYKILKASEIRDIAMTCVSSEPISIEKEKNISFDSKGRAKFANYDCDLKYISYYGSDGKYQYQCRCAYNRMYSRLRHCELKMRFHERDFDRAIREGFEKLFRYYEGMRMDAALDRKTNGDLIMTYNRLLRRFDLFMTLWEVGNYELIYPRLIQVIFPPVTGNTEPQGGNIEPQGLFSSLFATNDLSSALNNMTSSIDDIKSDPRIEAMLDLAQKMQTSEFKTELWQEFIKVLLVVLLVTFILYEMKSKDKRYKIMILSIAAYSAVTFGPDIWKLISRYISDEDTETVEPQGGDNIMTGIASLLMLGCVGNSKQIPIELFRSLSNFERVKSSLKDIYDFTLNIVEKIFTQFGIKSSLPLALFGIHSKNSDITSFINKVKKIENDIDSYNFSVIQDNFNILKAVINEGEQIIQTIPRDKDTSGFLTIISNEISMLKKLKNKFLETNFNFEGLRQEPVCLLLRGGPGVLKSQSLEHFCHSLAMQSLPVEKAKEFQNNPHHFIYNRQAETKYWDGYDHDKLITIYDDFGQCKDIAGNPDNEFMNLIRNVNEFENDLHMASLNSKGNVKFSSKFVLATTNMTQFNIESIVEINALLRRFSFCYTVVPKDEYTRDEDMNADLMARKIDFNKLPFGPLGVTSTSPEILRFHEYDLVSKNHTGKILSFTEVVEEMLRMERTKRLWHQQKILELRDRRDHGKKMRGDYRSAFTEDNLLDMLSVDELDLDYLDYFDDGLFLQQTSDEFTKGVAYFRTSEPVVYNQRCKALAVITPLDFISREFMLYGYYKSFGDDFMINFMNLEKRDYIFYIMNLDKSLLSPQYNISFSKNSVKYDMFGVTPRMCVAKLNDSYNIVVSKISEYLPISQESIKIILKWLSIISPCIALATYVFGKKQESGTPEMDYHVKNKETKSKFLTAKQLRQKFDAVPQMAYHSDPQGYQIVDKIRRRNCCEVSIETELKSGNFVVQGYCLFVEGRIALMPYHFPLKWAYKVFEDKEFSNSRVRLRKGRGVGTEQVSYYLALHELLPTVMQVESMENSDLCLVKFPIRVQPFSNIVKYFTTSQDLTNLRDYNFRLVVPGCEEVFSYCGKGEVVSNIVVKPTFSENYVIGRGLSYNSPTEVGDCGAILSILNSSYRNSKIFGMHVAGNSSKGTGYSSFITKEQIEECLNTFSMSDRVIQEMEDETIPQAGEILSRGQFEELYNLEVSVPQAFNTKIEKSLLYERVCPALLKPAHLRTFTSPSGEKINPWDKALDAYCTESLMIDQMLLNDVRCNYVDMLFRVSKKDVVKRIYTIQEAIMGTEDPDFIAISRQSSPGYPYIMDHKLGLPGKTRFFGTDVNYDLTSKECEEMIKDTLDILEDCKLNKRHEHHFVDCLKDELRPIEKCDAGKTRLFSACPIKLLILYRMYFGAYCVWFKKNRVENQSAIGINHYSFEWQEIANKLLQHGTSEDQMIGAGDYSRYDGSQKPDIHYMILDIINEWYGGTLEEENIRKILWLELVNSKHINGKLVYFWNASLPSGHPLTPIVNTMYNNIVYRWCWYSLHRFSFSALYEYDQDVWMIALGDDSVFSVHPSKRHLFHESSISEKMLEVGLIYTAEHKGERLHNLRKITEVEFLKKKFRYCNYTNRYVAPLRLERLLEVTNWTKKCHFSEKITEDNVKLLLEELTLHGSEIFEKYKPIILAESWDKLKYRPPCTTFRSLIDLIGNRLAEW